MPPGLVIFDCDGVLVDTEATSNRVMAAAISEAGLSMTTEEVTAQFEGMRLDDIAAAVEDRLGTELPAGWVATFEERRAAEFRKGVRPVPGIDEAIAKIHSSGIPTCVASQASLEKMQLTLTLSNLIHHFPQHTLFSSRMVEHGKPHPELFLLAAASMGCGPAACIVVEDGVLGARAGRLAGMTVLGYAPYSDGARLAHEGAQTFRSMTELPGLLGVG